MNLLDLRTVLIGYLLGSAISSAVTISLHFQNRQRSEGILFWAAGFICQFAGIVLIILRGAIPDFFSIVIANALLVLQVFAVFIGLERYIQHASRHTVNIIVLAVYPLVQAYFTYAQHNLAVRSILFSATIFFFCFQCALLLLRQVEYRLRPIARLTASVFLAYCLFSLVRIAFDLIQNPGSDLLAVALPDTLVILIYQVLSISLTFLLVLMVNQRLVSDLEEDILQRSAVESALRISEERFSKAFHNHPDAVLISLASDGTLLDVNESFSLLSGYTAIEAIGRTTVDLKLWKSPEDRRVFTESMRQKGRVRDVEATFYRKDGRPFTCLVSGETIRLQQGDCLLTIVHDITENKKIEEAEKEQRALAEALVNTSRAVNSSLKFDEVLDLILDNLGRVVPHDSANIMVLEDDRTALIMRSRGYMEHGQIDLTNQRVPLAEMPIIRRVGVEGRPAAIPNVRSEPDWRPSPEVEWVESYTVAPIRSRNRTIGFINLESARPGFFNNGHAERLQAFADQASIAIENARLYESVENLAVTDALTGLLNRRGLFQFGEREVARSQRFHHPLAAMMLDIDHFKKINDTFGHQAGDRVLAALASCLKTQVRNVDLAARYGGEEFLLLLSETGQPHSGAAAERIREAVENLVVPIAVEGRAANLSAQVTVSIGLVMLAPEMTGLQELIEAADRAMYAAKKAGRNRVVEDGGQ